MASSQSPLSETPMQTQERAMKASLDSPEKNNRPALHLIPRMLLWGVGSVLAFGARKYAAHNWRKGLPYSELGRAALGHVSLWLDGESTDPESGLPHLAHAACCIAFLLEYTSYPLTYGHFDDRHKMNNLPEVK